MVLCKVKSWGRPVGSLFNSYYTTLYAQTKSHSVASSHSQTSTLYAQTKSHSVTSSHSQTSTLYAQTKSHSVASSHSQTSTLYAQTKSHSCFLSLTNIHSICSNQVSLLLPLTHKHPLYMLKPSLTLLLPLTHKHPLYMLKPSLTLASSHSQTSTLYAHTKRHSVASSCYIVTYVDSHLHTCTYICRIIHSNTTIKTQEGKRRKTSLTIFFTSHFIARVRKGCSRVACERVLVETEHKLHILTPLLWPSRCVFLVLLMLGSTPSGGSEGPLGWVWTSLPHLVSNSRELETRFYWQLLWHPTQLNYIIIQRPRDRPLDLWNRMFNRHQAEITVMQFRGYSLPVHHCSGTMGPSPCPIS